MARGVARQAWHGSEKPRGGAALWHFFGFPQGVGEHKGAYHGVEMACALSNLRCRIRKTVFGVRH